MKKTLFFVILLLSFIGLTAEQIVVSQYPDDIRLTNSNPDNMELEFTLGSFYREPVTINGDNWYHLFLKKEGITLETGMPQVPILERSLIIPAKEKMKKNIILSKTINNVFKKFLKSSKEE